MDQLNACLNTHADIPSRNLFGTAYRDHQHFSTGGYKASQRVHTCVKLRQHTLAPNLTRKDKSIAIQTNAVLLEQVSKSINDILLENTDKQINVKFKNIPVKPKLLAKSSNVSTATDSAKMDSKIMLHKYVQTLPINVKELPKVPFF
ncbi:hypothetical protein HDV01_003023 [Terramyces sp. JEL0728]|nr:hypothetical protein HDV01_003023 [Terramyces sp. JEL0728]